MKWKYSPVQDLIFESTLHQFPKLQWPATNLSDYHLRCLASSASRKVVRLRSLSRLAWLLDSIVALFDTRDQNGTPKTWHLKKSRDWWTWNFRKLYMYKSSNWLASVGEGYSQTHTHLSEHLFIRELPIFHFDKCRSNFQTRIKGMLEGSQINHPWWGRCS